MSDGSFGRNALIGVAAVAVGALAWGTLVERRAYTLRETAVELLPPGSAPLRILHISDIHLAPWQEDKIQWIQSLAELSPDLIINTGDNLGHLNSLPALKEALSPFEGIPGVFVHGSNDYFAPEFKNPFAYFAGPSKAKTEATRLDTQALTSYFADKLGWANLNNSAAVMTLGERTISFMGVDFCFPIPCLEA
jgi:predicted MPP superfamily phosphohydrolase